MGILRTGNHDHDGRQEQHAEVWNLHDAEDKKNNRDCKQRADPERQVYQLNVSITSPFVLIEAVDRGTK